MYLGHCYREDYSGDLLLFKKKNLSRTLWCKTTYYYFSQFWSGSAGFSPGGSEAAEDIRGGCGQLKIHLHWTARKPHSKAGSGCWLGTQLRQTYMWLSHMAPDSYNTMDGFCMHACWVAQSYPTFCDPMDYRSPCSSVHEISGQEY